MIEQIEGHDVNFGPQNPVDYCRLPYPKHPLGCPNIDKVRSLDGFPGYLKPWIIRECPRSSPDENIFIDQVFDLKKPIYLIATLYPVGRDAEYRQMHSQKLTTTAQFYNLRYWQGRAKRNIDDEVEQFLMQRSSTETRSQFDQMSIEEIKMHTIVDLCPEAHGVKIIPTAGHVGLKITFGQWPPPKHDPELVRYQIALGGYPNDVARLIERGSLGRR